MSRNNIVVLMKSAFYLNHLLESIINTNYRIFMPAHYVYSTNNPICLALFPRPFTNKASLFLFFNLISFFLYWLFCFQVCFVLFRFILNFVSFGCLLLVLLQFFFFFAKSTINDFKFLPRRFIRLTNLRTFK